jgi:hypothetical protein
MTFRAQWYRDKFVKTRRKGFCGYPVATVAFYGPDDTRATKVPTPVSGRPKATLASSFRL